MEHCQRPWWKRPPVWFIGIAALLALIAGIVITWTNATAPMSYGAFLDQLDADNVANVTFQGTEVAGRFRRPPDATLPTGAAQRDTFSTRMPDFGDLSLVPELRKQHVAIDVSVPSAWTWLLGRIPFPILIFLGVMVVGAVIRFMRGGKQQSTPETPMHGPMGLVAGLFSKPQQTVEPPPQDGDKPKDHQV
jgi:uncharacterized integral membrane protein